MKIFFMCVVKTKTLLLKPLTTMLVLVSYLLITASCNQNTQEASVVSSEVPNSSSGQNSRYEELANLPFTNDFLSKNDVAELKDELMFQRAVQTYIWAIPALNMYSMKEGSEKTFGKGYNILPIFKERLNAKTLITTPNSDVIYALGFLDLKEDGPMVIEVPPGLQGILDDFFQRPICSEGMIEGRTWCGDVGLPGPDKGKGGKYLILPPDYTGKIPAGFITMRSRT